MLRMIKYVDPGSAREIFLFIYSYYFGMNSLYIEVNYPRYLSLSFSSFLSVTLYLLAMQCESQILYSLQVFSVDYWCLI